MRLKCMPGWAVFEMIRRAFGAESDKALTVTQEIEVRAVSP